MGLDFRGWVKLIATVGAAVCGTLAAGGTPQSAGLAGLVTLFAFIDKTIAGPQVPAGSSFAAPGATAETVRQIVSEAVAPVAQQAADAPIGPDSTAAPMPLPPRVTISADPVEAALASYTQAVARQTYPVAYVPRVDVDPEAAP